MSDTERGPNPFLRFPNDSAQRVGRHSLWLLGLLVVLVLPHKVDVERHPRLELLGTLALGYGVNELEIGRVENAPAGTVIDREYGVSVEGDDVLGAADLGKGKLDSSLLASVPTFDHSTAHRLGRAGSTGNCAAGALERLARGLQVRGGAVYCAGLAGLVEQARDLVLVLLFLWREIALAATTRKLKSSSAPLGPLVSAAR